MNSDRSLNLGLARCWVVLLALTWCTARNVAVRAAEKAVRINLGTLAPRGSSFHQSLQAMAENWKQAPGGGVRLVIYPDGSQGGETDMVRLMRVGSFTTDWSLRWGWPRSNRA